MMVEHESILLRRSEAEAGVEVVPQSGNVVQSQAQVALTGEVSLARHLHKKKNSSGVLQRTEKVHRVHTGVLSFLLE